MLLCSPYANQILPWRQATFATAVPVEYGERIVASFPFLRFDQSEAEINLGVLFCRVKRVFTSTRARMHFLPVSEKNIDVSV